MFSDVFRNIEREYEFKRSYAEKQFEADKKKIYADNPRLSEIDDAIKNLGISMSKTILSGDNTDKEKILTELENEIKILKYEKEQILKKLKVELKPSYSCKLCSDTGYIKTQTSTEMCSCFKQKLINESYHKSNLITLKEQTFDKFNTSLYSDIPNEEKYSSTASPRENIEEIKEIALEFVENFDKPEQKNLLFSGTTGLGKTFLSSCIANELLQRGHTVLYETAPVLMDTVFEYKYSKSASSSELYKRIFDVDLLIIDDLGTETVSDAKFSELFTIINSRLLKPNTKTIISTNLNLDELFLKYGDRITSRIIHHYHTCMFYGGDIRLKI